MYPYEDVLCIPVMIREEGKTPLVEKIDYIIRVNCPDCLTARRCTGALEHLSLPFKAGADVGKGGMYQDKTSGVGMLQGGLLLLYLVAAYRTLKLKPKLGRLVCRVLTDETTRPRDRETVRPWNRETARQ
jgi:hypothetical protein